VQVCNSPTSELAQNKLGETRAKPEVKNSHSSHPSATLDNIFLREGKNIRLRVMEKKIRHYWAVVLLKH
jgi:hypothetical protein